MGYIVGGAGTVLVIGGKASAVFLSVPTGGTSLPASGLGYSVAWGLVALGGGMAAADAVLNEKEAPETAIGGGKLIRLNEAYRFLKDHMNVRTSLKDVNLLMLAIQETCARHPECARALGFRRLVVERETVWFPVDDIGSW